MGDGTAAAERVSYRLEPGAGAGGQPVGSSSRAGLAVLVAYVGHVGVPRWPHSSQLTRHLRAFRGQHMAALREPFEDLVMEQSTVRQRLRRGERVVIDVDQTDLPANGRTLPGDGPRPLQEAGTS
jgi:hypothetical protein